MNLQILLISTYELGRQPFGLASPAAWLRRAGATVRCLDLAVEPLDEAAVRSAGLVAFYVPMHMATRMAVAALERVRRLNPGAHVCFFGLYAPENAAYLREIGVDTVLGGEFETALTNLARRLTGPDDPAPEEPVVSLERQDFLVPDRTGMPELSRYAHLVTSPGRQATVGYVEASRGCKHLCRHCPIVPVYNGRFRIVQREVVLADIRQQVMAGAEHITFGDPDFFNGIGHAIPLLEAFHREFPHLTYDVTIKVEHLLRHSRHLQTLVETGCLFVTSAVEAFDDRILALFDKRHTRADFETALERCRAAGLLLIPTFVAFTPWTTLAGYRHFLAEIARLEMVEQVAPIQLSLRLLLPPGSRLLEIPEIRPFVGELDESRFSYTWRNPDPRVDLLQQEMDVMVQRESGRKTPRREVFARVWERAFAGMAEPPAPPAIFHPAPSIPHMTEAWYC